MKKFMEWTKKPITWGSCFKIAGICTAISVLITGITYVVIFWDKVLEFFDRDFRNTETRN